jgi:SAM-dependent methyltransferase
MMQEIDSAEFYSDGARYDLHHARHAFAADIPFYIAQAHKRGEPILELGCGTGRITIPIANEGVEVWGLDISPEMLAAARRKSEALGLGINWVQADSRNFHLGQKFNLIFYPFNSIQHLLTLTELEDCLACVKEHLAPTGKFIVDIFNPSLGKLLNDHSQITEITQYSAPDGNGTIKVLESHLYHKDSQILEVLWHYRREDGGTETIPASMRIIFPQELDTMLKYCGLMLEEKLGDYDGSPFRADSPKQLAITRLP